MRTLFHPMLITALLGGSALSASAQSNAMVYIQGLCSFPVLSWSMQEVLVQPPINGQPATTVTVSATKVVDICSPKIYKAVVTGVHYETVELGPPDLQHPTDNRPQTALLALSTVSIVQSQLNDIAPSGMPTETISFTFQSFTTKNPTASSTSPTQTTLSLPDLSCTASVTAWSIGATNLPATNPTGGSGAGKPTLSTLQVTKALDACSQKLVQTITAGHYLTGAVLTQKDPATGSTFTTTLSSSQIKSYQVAGATNSGQPLETIQISYDRITFDMRTSSASSQVTWDASRLQAY